MKKLRLLFKPRYRLDFDECLPNYGACFIDLSKVAPDGPAVREHSDEFNFEFS